MLRAANGTGIMTYRTSTRHLEFPGVTLAHMFVLADVTKPLLGADFFDAHGLCVDFEGRRILCLVDSRVVFSIPATLAAPDSSSFRSPESTVTYWRNSKTYNNHVSGPTAMPTG